MQRIIGIAIGAVVTYLLLLLMDTMSGEATVRFGVAVIVGAVVSLLWPWVIGFFLLRRAKARRDEQIDKEVDKRMSEKG
jgi:prepilin signal peptidase PulO-like enzyme (type II secretory pathway)